MSSLAERAAHLYDTRGTSPEGIRPLIELAETVWPTEGQPFPDGVAEVARFAFIASRDIDPNGPAQDLWFARALVAAVLTGSRETAAGLLLPSFFRALDKGSEGAVDGAATARAILDELPRLVPEDDPAWSRLFARLYFEKGAALLLFDGQLPEAECRYDAALEFAHDARGRLKVRGGLALVRYLQADASRREPFIDETRRVLTEATDAGYSDVARWASTNLGVREAGQIEGWTPYEVL